METRKRLHNDRFDVPYELRDHTADVAVEATAPTLSALFAAVADGLTAASCEAVPESGDRFEVAVTAESREALLFDYLDQLIYERDVRLVLPADNRCSVRGPDETSDDEAWTVKASARGVPLADVAAREIKAVTYSEMALERRGDDWYAYVVLDV
jgi:SHS2 domain-containing protein